MVYIDQERSEYTKRVRENIDLTQYALGDRFIYCSECYWASPPNCLVPTMECSGCRKRTEMRVYKVTEEDNWN